MSVDVEGWAAGLVDLHGRVACRFGRAEPRRRALAYVRGLLAGLERKNGWTLAEHAGDASPDGMQRLLRNASWDTDGLHDDLRDYVVEHLGDAGGVLIADETGFLKKGVRSAGVQRQYSGTAGRAENCQLGVFLAYASAHGRALIDRELYMPVSWIEDRDRCRAAGVPDGLQFATKPHQAQAMLARAIAAGVPFRWFTADEAYGQVRRFRTWLEQREVFYVLATKRDDTVPALTAISATEVQDVIAAVPARGWLRRSCGNGAHGQRVYDWTRVALRPAAPGGLDGSWPAAAWPTASWPTTSATAPPAPH